MTDAQARIDSGNSKMVLGYVGIGAGAAVLATGVVSLLTGESSHRFDALAARARSKGPAWAFQPGPGQLGLGLGAAF